MADCPYKRWRHYCDPCTGEHRSIEFPCGKCASCLKNKQTEWRFRLMQSLYSVKGFIYDTLTVSDSNMLWLDCRDELADTYLQPHSFACVQHYDGFMPVLPKGLISTWIKRGREAWNSAHRKEINAGTCKRLSIKYLCCLEYGPKWSRPHIHLVMIGISHADYIKYFARPWRNQFGFTKTKYVYQDGKSARNVAKYISKYISKGSFESTAVFDGLQPSCYRCISHGIGIEYIERCKGLKSLRDGEYFKDFREHSFAPAWDGKYYDRVPDLPSCDLEFEYWNESPKYLQFTKEQETALNVCTDESGYIYRCPRYYRDIVCNSRSRSYLHAAVTRHSYEANLLRRNKALSEFAATLGIVSGCEYTSEEFEFWLFTRAGRLVFHKYYAALRHKAFLECKRCKVELGNHSKRPLLNPSVLSEDYI